MVVELLFGNRVDPLPLPFGAVSARDYLTFLHWKKLFEIIPLTTTDAQIVLKHKTLMYNKNNKDKDKDKDQNENIYKEDDRFIIDNLREQFFNSSKNDPTNKRNRTGGTESGPEHLESDFLESLIVSASYEEWLQINLPLKQIGIYLGKIGLDWIGLDWIGLD